MTAEAPLGEGKGGALTNLQTLYKDLVAYTRCFVTFQRGGDLDSNTVSYLNTMSCNSMGASTLERVRSGYEKVNPSTLGPNTDNHIKLLTATAAEYDRLHWAHTRLLLGGEEGLGVEDPGQPISLDETPSYFLSAERQGIIIDRVGPIPDIKIPKDPMDLVVRSLRLNFSFGREALVDGINRVNRDGRFRGQVLRAGIHKLGCLLAIADQFTFEERVKARPVDPDYTTWVDGNEEALYLSMFNEPKLPRIHSVYQRAHSLLLASADPNDPLLQHLFPMAALPNFKT